MDLFQNEWNGKIVQANNILSDLDITKCNVRGLEDKLKHFANVKTIITKNVNVIKTFECYKEYELKDEYCLNDGLYKCLDEIYKIILEFLQTIACNYSMKSTCTDEVKFKVEHKEYKSIDNDSYNGKFNILFITECCRKFFLFYKHTQQNENDEYICKKIKELESLVEKIRKDLENTLRYVLPSEQSQNMIDVHKFTFMFSDLSKLDTFSKIMDQYLNDSNDKSSKIMNIANASVAKLKSNITNKIKYICTSYSLNEMNASIDKLEKFNITNSLPVADLRRSRSVGEVETSTQLQLNESHTAPNPRRSTNHYVDIDKLLKSNLRKTNDEMRSRENTLVSFCLWLNKLYDSLSTSLSIDILEELQTWLDNIISTWIKWLCNACKYELKACNNLLFNNGTPLWNHVQTLLIECASLRKVDEVANDYETSIEYFRTIKEFDSRKNTLAKEAMQLINNDKNVNYDKIITIIRQLCAAGCEAESNEIKQIYDELKQYVNNLRSKIETMVLSTAINDSYDILIVIETTTKELNNLQTFAAIMPNIKQDCSECYKIINDHMLNILNKIKSKYDLCEYSTDKMKTLGNKLPLHETHNTLKFLNKCKIIKWNLKNKFEQKPNVRAFVLSNEYVSKIHSNVSNCLHEYGSILESRLTELINKLEIKCGSKCDLNNEEYVKAMMNTVAELTDCLREFREISNFDQQIIYIYANKSKQSKPLKLVPFLFTNPDIQLGLDDYINDIISDHKRGILMNLDQSKIYRIDKLPVLYFMCISMIEIDKIVSPKNKDNTYFQMASRINDELEKFCNNKRKQIVPLFENGELYQLKDILATLKKTADADERGIAHKNYGNNISLLLAATNKLISETKRKLLIEINNNDVTDNKILHLNNQLNRVKNTVEIIYSHLYDQIEKDKLKTEQKALGKFLSSQLMQLMQGALRSVKKQRDFLQCETLLNNTSKFMDHIDTQFYIPNIDSETEQKNGYNIDNTIVIEFRKIEEQINEVLDKILQQVTVANKSLTDAKVFNPYNRLGLVRLYDQLTTSQNDKFRELWYTIYDNILNTIKNVFDEIEKPNNTKQQTMMNSSILRKIELSLPKFPNEMKQTIQTMLKHTKENVDELQTIIDSKQAFIQQRFTGFTCNTQRSNSQSMGQTQQTQPIQSRQSGIQSTSIYAGSASIPSPSGLTASQKMIVSSDVTSQRHQSSVQTSQHSASQLSASAQNINFSLSSLNTQVQHMHLELMSGNVNNSNASNLNNISSINNIYNSGPFNRNNNTLNMQMNQTNINQMQNKINRNNNQNIVTVVNKGGLINRNSNQNNNNRNRYNNQQINRNDNNKTQQRQQNYNQNRQQYQQTIRNRQQQNKHNFMDRRYHHQIPMTSQRKSRNTFVVNDQQNYSQSNNNNSNQNNNNNNQNHSNNQTQFGFPANANPMTQQQLNALSPTNVDHIIDRVYFIAKTQSGSRFVQEKLSDKQYFGLFFKELKCHVAELMVDNFGHYAIEALFSHCNDHQRLILIENLSNHMPHVACHKQGSFSIQAIMDTLSTVEQIKYLVETLNRDIKKIILNHSGHHVILKFLQRYDYPHSQFIHEAVMQHTIDLATNHYGLKVMKASVDAGQKKEKLALFASIVKYTNRLVENQYGSYMIQHLLDLGPKQVTDIIKQKMLEKFVRYSKQKFSSNVVEKCLRHSINEIKQNIRSDIRTMDWTTIIVRELLTKTGDLISNKYGNYCLQTALQAATDHPYLLHEFEKSIKPHLDPLRGNVKAKWVKLLESAIEKQKKRNQMTQNMVHMQQQNQMQQQPMSQQQHRHTTTQQMQKHK